MEGQIPAVRAGRHNCRGEHPEGGGREQASEVRHPGAGRYQGATDIGWSGL